jgi:diacylglycerol kinase (ATP)
VGGSKLHFVVNPAAGRNRGTKIMPIIQQAMESRGESFGLSVTSGPGEASKLAALAAREADVIVAVGGDGTINEVVNGIRGRDVTLGILPVGSGNDFVKMLSIPINVAEAIQLLFNGRERKVDLGVVNDRLFVNSLGIGIDAAVARTMNRCRWLPGKAAYHYGVFTNLFFYHCRTIRWSADDEEGEMKSLLAAVMNGTTYGGGFHVAPKARCDDGLLDMVIAGRYGVVGRARYLPVFKKGKHLSLPKVVWRRARKVKIMSDSILPIQVDGELLSTAGGGTEVEIEVIEGGLKVIAPAPAD